MRVIYPLFMLIELMLYYTSMVIVSTKLFGAVCHKKRLLISYIVLFVPLLMIELTGDFSLANQVSILFFVPEILFLRLCLSRIRLRTLMAEYCSMYMCNILLTSAILAIIPLIEVGAYIVELIVHIVMLAVCCVVSCTSWRFKIKPLFDWTPRSTKWLLLIKLICNGFLSTIVLHHPLLEDQLLSNILTLSFIILLVVDALLISVLLVYTVTNKHILGVAENYEKQIKAQADYYRKLAESNLTLRRFRHDSHNIYIGLEKLLSENKAQEAIQMLHKGREECFQQKPQYDTGNGIVDALLEDKSAKGQTIHTGITFEGAVPAAAIEPMDLCVIFGNTLDNALEACEKLPPEQEKTIAVQCSGKCGFLFIDITNPVLEPVSVKGGVPATTKKDKKEHGLGLYSLQKIVKKYEGTIQCDCDTAQFTISVSLHIPAAVLLNGGTNKETRE